MKATKWAILLLTLLLAFSPAAVGRFLSLRQRHGARIERIVPKVVVVAVVIDTRSAHKLRGAGVYCHAASADIVDYRLYKGFRIFLRQASWPVRPTSRLYAGGGTRRHEVDLWPRLICTRDGLTGKKGTRMMQEERRTKKKGCALSKQEQTKEQLEKEQIAGQLRGDSRKSYPNPYLKSFLVKIISTLLHVFLCSSVHRESHVMLVSFLCFFFVLFAPRCHRQTNVCGAGGRSRCIQWPLVPFFTSSALPSSIWDDVSQQDEHMGLRRSGRKDSRLANRQRETICRGKRQRGGERFSFLPQRLFIPLTQGRN